MAKRAVSTFHIALEDGKRTFVKDAVVPAAIAKRCGPNVYDDGPAKKAAAAEVDG